VFGAVTGGLKHVLKVGHAFVHAHASKCGVKDGKDRNFRAKH